MLEVYVDGCFEEGRYSGAYVVMESNNILFQDNGIGSTDPELLAMRNISGEITAAMRGARWLKLNNKKGIIVHDYTGVAHWVTGEWSAKKKYTKKYQQYMQPLFKEKIIQFKWVRGHMGTLGNEIADRLASEAIRFKKEWSF